MSQDGRRCQWPSLRDEHCWILLKELTLLGTLSIGLVNQACCSSRQADSQSAGCHDSYGFEESFQTLASWERGEVGHIVYLMAPKTLEDRTQTLGRAHCEEHLAAILRKTITGLVRIVLVDTPAHKDNQNMNTSPCQNKPTYCQTGV